MGFWEIYLPNKMKDEGYIDEKNLNYKEEKLFRKCIIWIDELKNYIFNKNLYWKFKIEKNIIYKWMWLCFKACKNYLINILIQFDLFLN